MGADNDHVRDLIAARIGGVRFGLSGQIYKFEKIKQAKRAALAANPDAELLDFGVGEPDAMADPDVVRILSEEAAKPENRFYADNGIEARSEERRVGKECRSRGWPDKQKTAYEMRT